MGKIRKDDDGALLVDFSDCKIERLNLVRPKLLIVEHFDPASALESGRFTLLGVGRPSDSKKPAEN
jgi:hypothetical protein